MRKIIEKARGILINQDFSNEKIIIGSKKISIKDIIIKKIELKKEHKEPSSKENKINAENIWFVDGGITIGYYANTLAIAKIRIAAVEYNINKKARNQAINKEFTALVYDEDGETKILTEPEPELELPKTNSRKTSNKQQTENLKILEFLNQTRRNAEINMLLKIGKDGKIAVIDGPLIREEDDLETINKLTKKTEQLLGIIKLSEDSTDKGRPTCYALSRQINVKEPWFCIIDENEIITGYTKLSENSKLVLKFQATKYTNLEETLSLISKISQDPIFPGYPYGLIEADEIARISNTEKEEFTATILNMSKNSKELEEAQQMSKPHDILDKIRY